MNFAFSFPNPVLDPVRIARDAADILASGKQALKLILSQRAALDRAGLHDKTLVVPMGEDHGRPASIVHHMVVLDGLRRERMRVAVAAEAPHDTLTDAFATLEGKSGPTDAEAKALHDADNDAKGGLSLAALRAFRITTRSPETIHAYHRFLAARGLPFLANDASFRPIDGYTKFNPADPLTAAAFRTYHGQPINSVDIRAYMVSDNEAVAVRNINMSRLGAAFAIAHKPRVLFQSCGASHVAGGRDLAFGDCEYKDSLSARFAALGFPVLPFPMARAPDSLPDGHRVTRDAQGLMDRLPGTSACYDHVYDAAIPGYLNADLKSRADEAAYTNGLLRHCGLADIVMTPQELAATRAALTEDLEDKFIQIRRDVRRL